MNHRCCRRFPVSIEARIRSRERRDTRATVTNIGRGGAYVETPRANLYPIDSIIELTLLPARGGRTSTVVQGMVVHRNARGFGIMFLDENSAGISELHERHAATGREQRAAVAL